MTQMIFQNASPEFFSGSNTFRLGRKWFDALKLGDTVEAVDLEGNKLGANLKVKSLTLDYLDACLRYNALNNHGVKQDGITDQGDAAHQLRTILEGVYPDISNDDLVTVVEFE